MGRGVNSRVITLIVCAVGFILFGFGCKSNKKDKPPTSVLSFFSEKDFNIFFPQHSKFFTYHAFKKAVDEMSSIEVKIEKRGNWIYKITRIDIVTGQSAVVRQDADWPRHWKFQVIQPLYSMCQVLPCAQTVQVQ